MIYLSLVHNIALLVALSLVHGLLMRGFRRVGFRFALLSGLLFGAVAVLGMMSPVRWAPGIIFDGRSIILGIAGLFGGPLAAGVAALLAGAYRTLLGGAGIWMGLAVILEAAALGTLGFYLRQRWARMTGLGPLLGLGMAIHLLMVALMGLLPGGLDLEALKQVALPVLLLYPPGFMLVGRMFVELERHFLTEDALRESEARNRALLDSIPDLMFRFTEEGRITDYHASDERRLYAPPERFLGHTVEEVLPPDVARLTRARIQQVATTGLPARYEYDLTFPDNQTRRFESRLVPCGPGEHLAIVRDISEREAALKALRESQSLYEDLMASTLAGIYRLREEGPDAGSTMNLPKYRFDFLNDRFCELTGLSREAHLSDPNAIHRVIHPEDRPGWLARNQVAVAENAPFAWDGRLVVRGEARWVHFESRPRVLSDGTRMWTGAVVDVHERVQAQAERQDMERRMLHVQKLESLGVLAGGMAHDFNNILMAVLGHADLALAKLPTHAPARDHLEAIVTASRQASDLSRQMLAYSGRGRFIIEPIQLSDLVAEMAHLLKAAISKKALFNLKLEKGLPKVEGDATQLRQVLMNLITNASEAIGDRSGVITLCTGAMHCGRSYLTAATVDDDLPEGLYVYMEVSDTGCGMDRDTLQRIYDPFFSTKFTGRGLGMAAVLGIVRGHNGAIRVYSEVGKGTTFKVLLPAAQAEDEPTEAAPQAAGTWSGAGRVLLVDDEETLRALGQAMLERLGFEVLTASDGREAVALYRQHREQIDLVLLDLTMPHMDGEEAFRELRQINPEVRVVLCSGYTEQDVTARFAGKGLAGFIQKPYTLQDLSDRLRACLTS